MLTQSHRFRRITAWNSTLPRLKWHYRKSAIAFYFVMSLNEHDVVLPGLMDMEETPPPTRPPLVSKALSVQPTEVVVKRNQSKYDFVKVRVWVEDHVYVLSRYLLCRALVSAKVTRGLGAMGMHKTRT